MSRTKRSIPFGWQGLLPFEKAWIGLGFTVEKDPRNKTENGYDCGKGRSYLRMALWNKCHNHNFTGKTRKLYKRRVSKHRRKYGKSLCEE